MITRWSLLAITRHLEKRRARVRVRASSADLETRPHGNPYIYKASEARARSLARCEATDIIANGKRKQ